MGGCKKTSGVGKLMDEMKKTYRDRVKHGHMFGIN